MARFPILIAIAVLLPVVLLTPGVSPAQDEVLGVDPSSVVGPPESMPIEDETILIAMLDELSMVIRCPKCQGQSIAESPADAAQSMKKQVRELLAVGYTDEQILNYLEYSYGEFIRQEPKAQGFTWTLYLAPVLLLGLGLIVLVSRLSAKGRSREQVPDDMEELLPYLERVRREVGR